MLSATASRTTTATLPGQPHNQYINIEQALKIISELLEQTLKPQTNGTNTERTFNLETQLQNLQAELPGLFKEIANKKETIQKIYMQRKQIAHDIRSILESNSLTALLPETIKAIKEESFKNLRERIKEIQTSFSQLREAENKANLAKNVRGNRKVKNNARSCAENTIESIINKIELGPFSLIINEAITESKIANLEISDDKLENYVDHIKNFLNQLYSGQQNLIKKPLEIAIIYLKHKYKNQLNKDQLKKLNNIDNFSKNEANNSEKKSLKF